MSINLLPLPLLDQIIQYVPFPDRWEISLVCKRWYESCHDPYLYQEIILENMELNMAVRVLQWISRIQPQVKSFILRNCYSTFLRTTLIPIPFTNNNDNNSRMEQQPTLLYSPLRNLSTDKRRLEYMKHNYYLYDQFSAIIGRLLLKYQRLTNVEITGCDLDFAMTDLFTIMMNGAGKQLTSWIYQQNYHPISSSLSTCFPSADILQALIVSCPNMKHFISDHEHMTDHVLFTMAKHWQQLETLSLTSSSSSSTSIKLASSNINNDSNNNNSNNNNSDSDKSHSPISSHAFFELISKCHQLHTLQLYDMDFMNQQDLLIMCDWKDNSTVSSLSLPSSALLLKNRHYSSRYHPYSQLPFKKRVYHHHHPSYEKNRIGSSLKHLKITKFLTSPLNCHGISNLMVLFPHLETLEYHTNSDCFYINMGMCKDQFLKEKHQIMQWCQTSPFRLIPHWDQPSTIEQRLLTSMVSLF